MQPKIARQNQKQGQNESAIKGKAASSPILMGRKRTGLNQFNKAIAHSMVFRLDRVVN